MAAVEDEIAPIRSLLSDRHSFQIGNKPAYSGYIAREPVMLIQSGIGMINAAQAITAVIEHYSVKLIINTGCSGVFLESGLSIGDIGIATSETDIHSGIESLSGENSVDPLPFPLIQTTNEYYFAQYPTSKKLTQQAFDIVKDHFQSRFTIKQTPFLTVSTITASQERVKALYRHYKAGMENMEGAGVAHVAIQYDIPFIEIRTASNIVGDRNKTNWRLKDAFKRSAEAIQLLMYYRH
jgi:futalosine hydrolase